MSEQHLKGQVALVTGGSSGIGATSAYFLAKAGAKVVVNYYKNEDGAHEVVDQIKKNGGEAVALKADISKEDEVQAMFEKLFNEYGKLDILLSNAGIQKDAAFTEMTLKAWNAVLAVNLTGAFLTARAAVKHFLERGIDEKCSRAAGKIIFMSSVHQEIPWAGHANYAAAKGGLTELMHSLAQEVAEHKIRVNNIAPGAIKTSINKKVWEDEESRNKLKKVIPYQRIGETEDIARAVVWLASDQSDYITGTTLFIDGGMMLYPGFKNNG